MFRQGTVLLLIVLACASSGCGMADFWMPEPKAARCPAGCGCPDCQATSAYDGHATAAPPPSSRVY
jgi:hypothetical protein